MTNIHRLPLKQHIGTVDKPTVKIGEKVQRGEIIAEANGFGVNIHEFERCKSRERIFYIRWMLFYRIVFLIMIF